MTIPVVKRTLKDGRKRYITIDTGERLKEVHICVQEGKFRNAVNIKHDEIPVVVTTLIKASELPDELVKFQDDTYNLMMDYVELKRMLDEIPETSDSNEFDYVVETRRRVLQKLRARIDNLGNKLERKWAQNLWEKVKNKTPK